MIDLWTLTRFVAALLFVLALIGGAAWVARRYAAGGAVGPGGRRRLSLIETLFLDGKSRLVLVRRDDAEHLLILGPQGAQVVETNIAAKPGAVPPQGETRTVRGV